MVIDSVLHMSAAAMHKGHGEQVCGAVGHLLVWRMRYVETAEFAYLAR